MSGAVRAEGREGGEEGLAGVGQASIGDALLQSDDVVGGNDGGEAPAGPGRGPKVLLVYAGKTQSGRRQGQWSWQ